MRKRLPLLFAVGLLLAAEPPGDAAKDDLKKMQGEWIVEEAQRGGNTATGDELKKMLVTIKGSRITIDVGEARDEVAQMTLDPNEKPAAVDLKARGNEVMKGIYKLDGGMLTVCWSKEGERPTEFASKSGTMQVLLVMKRRK